MGIILWIIFGGALGWLASLIMRTDEQQGILLNVIVGIIGALLGGVVMSMIGSTEIIPFHWYSFLVALGGAIVLIGIVQTITRSSRGHSGPRGGAVQHR